MKVLFPRDIPKGIFSMHLTIGPLTITLVQMFIMAIGISIALVVFNSTWWWEDWNKVVAALIALPVFLLFVFIAFFKVSELWLLAFGAKLLRTNFFDATKKFQTNYKRFDPYIILQKKFHNMWWDEIIESKTLDLDKKTLDQIENWGLL